MPGNGQNLSLGLGKLYRKTRGKNLHRDSCEWRFARASTYRIEPPRMTNAGWQANVRWRAILVCPTFCPYNKYGPSAMYIEFDEMKRLRTLRERHLDFDDAAQVLSGPTLNLPDTRYPYREPRIISMGLLRQRVVVIVWTPRHNAHRIISMRFANERERRRFFQTSLARPG